jgi:hypothetical protein
MKKLFKGMRKRLAKKIVGHRWYNLQYGLSLKPGDLVSSCRGYNERIKTIEPETICTSRGWVISDFDITTETGMCCSLIHCCTFPLETREEIIEYFKSWRTPEAIAASEKGGFPFYKEPMTVAVVEGKEVFDENGEPHYEYCANWSKKYRFPDRFLSEMRTKIVPQTSRSKAISEEEAYNEGWSSFAEVWADETNPYPQGKLAWSWTNGRRDAVECLHATR